MRTIQLLFAVVLSAGMTVATSVPAKDLTLYAAPATDGVLFGDSPKHLDHGGSLADVVAAARAARESSGDNFHPTILLRGGTYELSEPLVLTAEDSGLTLAAYQKERPVLSGGRQIPGWQRVPGKADWWQATVPDVASGQWYFHTLFINGRRAQRARTPNTGFFRIDGDSPNGNPAKFHFHEGDIRKSWVDSGDTEVIALLAWADFRMFLREVDESNHVATLSAKPRVSNREKNARYYIENTPDALDAPGERYLNRKTGVVTYIARPGEDLSKAMWLLPA